MFPGERLVLPAGTFKVRSYDTDYRFRPDTAHTYFSGNQTSDAVLVIEDGESVLYARPSSARETDEFFRDRQYGELWVGRRPSLEEISASLGLEVRHLDDLAPALGGTGKTRVHRGVSAVVDALVSGDDTLDADFARVISEMRLVKDDWEVGELQTGVRHHRPRLRRRVARVGAGCWSSASAGSRAPSSAGPARWATTSATTRSSAAARTPPRCTGSRTPARSTPGKLVLLDMGVEGHNLYTADVTRTLPVDGTFTPLQRDLYTLVYDAQEAGIAAVKPGEPFNSSHNAAMVVLAHGLEDLGLLPVSAEEALDPESKVYSRWTLHGVSHMLGMDVHDCGQAAPEAYAKGTYAEGMVLTVEPGLYFQADDLLVPEELRGIGIRIEDDVLVTADGTRNLSGSLPRTADDVEAWFAEHRR